MGGGRASRRQVLFSVVAGARVTRIDAPGGSPSGAFSGCSVWASGKRSALLDLTEPGRRNVVLELASRADVVVESFAPGVTQDLGVDYETLCAKNDRLVYCSITGYGTGAGQHADRPGYDMLVAARTASSGSAERRHRRDHRETGRWRRIAARAGTARRRVLGRSASGWSAGIGRAVGEHGHHAYLATLAIGAALRERELSGDVRPEGLDVTLAGHPRHHACRMAAHRALSKWETTNRG